MAVDKRVEQKSLQSVFLKMYAEVLGLSADSISTALQDIMRRVMTHRKVMYSILETLEPDEQEAAWVLLGDYLPARPTEPINVEGLILDEAATDAFYVEELDVDDLNTQQEQDNTVSTQETTQDAQISSQPVATEPVVEPTIEADVMVEPATMEICEGEDPSQAMIEDVPQETDNDIPPQAEADVEAAVEAEAVAEPTTTADPVVTQNTATPNIPKKRGGPRGPRAPKVVVDGDAFDGDLVAVTLDGTRTAAKSLRTAILILFRKVVDENKLGEARASWFKQLDEAVTDERLYRKLEGTDIKVFLNLAVPDCKKRVQALLNILKCDITLHFTEGDRTVSGISG